jgi:hypothetical protein
MFSSQGPFPIVVFVDCYDLIVVNSYLTNYGLKKFHK